MSERGPELEVALAELETRLERLRASYEQYFLGFERAEPASQRLEVDRSVVALRRRKIRNTARRHRFQALVQRYNLYKEHWRRICRQIENGTFHRHVARAEKRFGDQGIRAVGRPARRRPPSSPRARRAAPRGEGANGKGEEDGLRQLLRSDPSAALRQAVEASERHSVPPPPMPAAAAHHPGPANANAGAAAEQGNRAAASASEERPAPAPPKPARGSSGQAPSRSLTDDRIRELHGRVMKERQRLNLGGDLSTQALARSLRETEAQLQRRYGDRAVDFRVVVVDGRVRVKPVLG